MVLFSAGWVFGEIYEDGVFSGDRNAILATSGASIFSPSTRLMALPKSSEKADSPQDTVESLHSRSGEPQEPSAASEERYVTAIRSWLATLAPFQREKARKIMVEAHPALQNLRNAIRDKKSELASLSFDRGMPPETLPRLGMELQQLRSCLNNELKKVNEKLRYEAGIKMDTSRQDSFWLFPPDDLKN